MNFPSILQHCQTSLTCLFEELLEQEQSEARSPSARTSWLSLEDITLLRGRQGDWSEGSRKKFRSYIDIENDFQHLKSEITHMKSSMNSVSFLRKKKSFSNCKASKQIGSIHIERPKASVKKLLSFKYLILTTFDKNITSVENF